MMTKVYQSLIEASYLIENYKTSPDYIFMNQKNFIQGLNHCGKFKPFKFKTGKRILTKWR